MPIDSGKLALLLLAGVGAGLTGATAGLASLVSYPALLAAGLPPLSANMTNTVAMLGTTVGAATGARPELKGQARRLLPLGLITTAGGGCGSLVLLLTPSGAFTQVVPGLIGGASLVLMAGPRLRRRAAHAGHRGIGPVTGGAAFLVGVYGGYFGAAAGVLMLALLTTAWNQPLARANAAKNVATGAANLIAAVVFGFTGEVDWPAALVLGLGSVGGSWLGSVLVRYLPANPLRIAIGIGGLVLAVVLGRAAFTG
ncbi:sulfite exporter TauE/SafE family protein [Amycolatopsis sp. PS_44_ISF1]|uniref:sulfite exporter TauE/SafE family protein n=1 Tax=Amycolatopsis sp. PS_44_ISF1 TaxID=2974917 RepID=UPI0028DE5326|nr:sulfite exporter TauE/SafE family protein [Amycolatopsis sp. PS_44_ISF1]MDT8912491.1 sulfite exporter TauE/SafE family protein [Amycolatopsis sp. PS_44_ISF1]